MPETFDIVIIGAGPGGYATALRAAQLDLSVALVERDATLGGTCLNRGCIPSKALLTAMQAVDTAQRTRGNGPIITVEGIDYAALADYRRHAVDTMVGGLTGLVAQRGITVFRAQAAVVASCSDAASVSDASVAPTDTVASTISDSSVISDTSASPTSAASTAFEASEACGASIHTVRLFPAAGCDAVMRMDGSGTAVSVGTTCDLTARNVVLATGSRPRPLPGEPFHGTLIDSTQALELEEFPSSAVIVGSGAIALEFASIWSRGGCQTTLLIRKDRVLSGWDRRVSSTLTRELTRAGINVITRSQVVAVQTADSNADSSDSADSQTVVRYTRNGEEHEVAAQVVLAAIGRDPVTDASWMDDLNLNRTERGHIVIDAVGRTSVPGIWAVGDITAGHALAHRAFEQGIVVAESIAGLEPRPLDETTVPQIVFSFPQAASVGLTLEQARERDDIATARQTAYPMAGNARMAMDGENGALSVVTGAYTDKPDTEVVLGVHMVAPDASDLIAEAQQLVGNRIPLSDAARLVHPHPTFSETIGEALLKADGRPLHTR